MCGGFRFFLTKTNIRHKILITSHYIIEKSFSTPLKSYSCLSWQQRAALHPRFVFLLCIGVSVFPLLVLKLEHMTSTPAFSHVNYQSLHPGGKESSKENKPKQPNGSITGMWVCYTHSGLPSLQQVLKICALALLFFFNLESQLLVPVRSTIWPD